MSGRFGEVVISSESPFKGKLIKVEVDRVRLPSGKESSREIVIHKGAAAIVAVEGGRVLLERQFRLTAKKVLWEVPAGSLEDGELPEDCARRELLEETGYEAKNWMRLLHFFVAPGYSTEIIHIFHASGLKKSKASPNEDEQIESTFVPMEEALEMVQSNIIEDSKTIIGLLLARYMLPHRYLK